MTCLDVSVPVKASASVDRSETPSAVVVAATTFAPGIQSSSKPAMEVMSALTPFAAATAKTSAYSTC